MYVLLVVCIYKADTLCLYILAVKAVLSHKHDALGENVISVKCVIITEKPCYSIVPVKVLAPSGNMEPISHEPFSIDIAQHYMTYLKFYHQNIDEQLNILHAAMQLDEEHCKLWLVPCEGHESVEDWQS